MSDTVDVILVVCDAVAAHPKGRIVKVATFSRSEFAGGRRLSPTSGWAEVLQVSVRGRAEARARGAAPLDPDARAIDKVLTAAVKADKPEVTRQVVGEEVDERPGAAVGRPDADPHVTVRLRCGQKDCTDDLQRRGEAVAEVLDKFAAAGVGQVSLSALAATMREYDRSGRPADLRPHPRP